MGVVVGAFDLDYLHRRHRVHRLAELGWSMDRIAENTGLDSRLVKRYLKMVKPIFPKRVGYSWLDDAACRGMDTRRFFPSVRGRHSVSVKRRVAQVCAGCPVKAECWQSAVANFEEHGIWGGEDFSRARYTFDEGTGVVSMLGGDGGEVAQVG